MFANNTRQLFPLNKQLATTQATVLVPTETTFRQKKNFSISQMHIKNVPSNVG